MNIDDRITRNRLRDVRAFIDWMNRYRASLPVTAISHEDDKLRWRADAALELLEREADRPAFDRVVIGQPEGGC